MGSHAIRTALGLGGNRLGLRPRLGSVLVSSSPPRRSRIARTRSPSSPLGRTRIAERSRSPRGRLSTRQTKSSNVVAVQERVWKERKFTDAVVVCDGQRFDVYRATLSAASPVFEVAFSSNMEEGRSAVYNIKESTPAAVESMLRFIYTGSISVMVSEDDVAPLFDLAIQYGLQELANDCASKLIVNVTKQNVHARTQLLKRHSGSSTEVKKAWDRMVDMLQSKRELLVACL
eukprot:gnl/MRDRNA2_/MRDRNA2_32547_c0_seq1.p1 gnl/MRDRNA2_/MRDRNA2_32547_c0~~gnl/MRDRNA2_/MRDRNA2_32547_c0_seq1.p1  ORF type:complete len:232 (-),score=18.96 gnl/MRDRNA2_/MRDRNA2_32547_c0_seq1:261-956(-)